MPPALRAKKKTAPKLVLAATGDTPNIHHHILSSGEHLSSACCAKNGGDPWFYRSTPTRYTGIFPFFTFEHSNKRSQCASGAGGATVYPLMSFSWQQKLDTAVYPWGRHKFGYKANGICESAYMIREDFGGSSLVESWSNPGATHCWLALCRLWHRYLAIRFIDVRSARPPGMKHHQSFCEHSFYAPWI